MLADSSSKESFTTLTEETRNTCSCGYDKAMLKERLEEILNSLYQEIGAKQKQIQKAHKASSESIRQKQEIIERLVSANSKLVIQNQALYRRLAKTQIYSKSTITEVQSKYKAIVKDMKLQIDYLEQRNEFLKSEILNTLSIIPQDLLPYQITPKAPRSRCSNKNFHPSTRQTHQTRYSHLSYKSPPGRRITADLSPPGYTTYWGTNKSRKRNSNRTESRGEDVGLEDLAEKRSKSTVSRKECSVGGK